jgi:hypothetical protein
MQETQMPTNEQIIRLIDIAMSEKGKDLAYDPTLSPTRSDYTPLITDVLVENMRYQLPEGSRPLTDLIGCVTHYHGVEGVDYRPISIDQAKMLREHLFRHPNINPFIKNFRHLVMGVARGSHERPYDVTSWSSICLGLY